MILAGVTGKLISFSHRNFVTFLCFNCSPIWRKASSMSATIPIFFVWNLISSPQISSKMTGPLCKHSLNYTQFCGVVFWFDVWLLSVSISTFVTSDNIWSVAVASASAVFITTTTCSPPASIVVSSFGMASLYSCGFFFIFEYPRTKSAVMRVLFATMYVYLSSHSTVFHHMLFASNI